MNNRPPNEGLRAYYAAKRQRTIEIVQKAVNTLEQKHLHVTIAAICATSRDIDPQGKGITSAGVLGNTDAYAYYCQHSTTHVTYMKRRKGKAGTLSQVLRPYHFTADRDPQRARYKYLHKTRAELVERLLSLEQAYAEIQQQLIRVQFALAEKQVQ